MTTSVHPAYTSIMCMLTVEVTILTVILTTLLINAQHFHQIQRCTNVKSYFKISRVYLR